MAKTRNAILMVVLFNMALIIGAAVLVWRAQELVLQDARHRTHQLSSVLAELTRSNLTGLTAVAEAVKPALSPMGRRVPQAPGADLATFAAALPMVRAFLLTDADGLIVASSSGPRFVGMSVSQRSYFREAAARRDGTFRITAPVLAHADQAGEAVTRVVPVSAPIRDPRTGDLWGVLTADLDPGPVEAFHVALDAEYDPVVAIVDAGGKVLIRAPAGRDLPEDSLIGEMIGLPSDRLGAALPITGFDAFIYVSVDRTGLLSNAWGPLAMGILGGTLALGGSVSLLVWRLQRVLQDRQLTRQQIESVLDTVGEAVFLLGDDSRVRTANLAAEAVFGAPERTLQGRDVGELIQGVDWPSVAANGGRSGSAEPADGGCQGYRVDGSCFPAELNLTVWTQGDREYRTLVVRDLTQRERTEQMLRRSQRMDALGQLAGGVAHDFNNLLAIIIGNLEVVAEQVPKGHPLRMRVETAIRNAHRGAALAGRMLAFARSTPESRHRVVLAAFLEAVRTLMERSLTARIALVISPLPKDLAVSADPSDLEDALINLVLNARDAMPDGGRLIIEATPMAVDEESAPHLALSPGTYVAISVSDTGIGLPSELAERVFDPFFTTKGSEGTGLGLSMVYSFARRNGGAVRLYSEEGVGTTVRLFLPRVATESDTEVASLLAGNGGGNGADREEPSEALPVPTGRGELLLVVDDEPDLRQITAEQLRSRGYRVETAADAQDALAWLEQQAHTTSGVISDVIMPGPMNGQDLVTAVGERWPWIARVLVSGFTERAAEGEAKPLPSGVPMLTKPFSSADLARVVAQVLTDGRRRDGTDLGRQPHMKPDERDGKEER